MCDPADWEEEDYDGGGGRRFPEEEEEATDEDIRQRRYRPSRAKNTIRDEGIVRTCTLRMVNISRNTLTILRENSVVDKPFNVEGGKWFDVKIPTTSMTLMPQQDRLNPSYYEFHFNVKTGSTPMTVYGRVADHLLKQGNQVTEANIERFSEMHTSTRPPPPSPVERPRRVAPYNYDVRL